MSQKSILNYFSRTPKTPNGQSNGNGSSHSKTPNGESSGNVPINSKTPSNGLSNGKSSSKSNARKWQSDEDASSDSKKVDKSDSEEEALPFKRPRISLTSTFDKVADAKEELPAKDEEMSDEEKGEKPFPPSVTPSGSNAFLNKFANFQPTPVRKEKLDRTESWPHLSFEFLKPDQIKDSAHHPPSHPDYNPRTLFVPPSFFKTLTPGFKQWWTLKSENFDTVLLFRVGKFYEMYHMDAVTGVEQVNLTFMKGDFAHCGFPEAAYWRYSSRLVEKGFKIARIEQTESAIDRDDRKKKKEGGGACVRREICEKATQGVRYASFQDHETDKVFPPEASYLYSIVEQTRSNDLTQFGVCFLDTTIGMFNIGQFVDDKHYSRLRTLFSHHNPVQILFEKKRISPQLQHIFQNMGGVRKDPLIPESEFWSATKAIKFLSERDYFVCDGEMNWPEVLKPLFERFSPVEGWEVGWRALGAIVWYLHDCLLDHDLLSLRKFQVYQPIDSLAQSIREKSNPKYMVLDGITLRNLDIMNCKSGLLFLLDSCGTYFGRRLLRNWIAMPLARPQEINERQDAIEYLIKSTDATKAIIPMLKSLPDLERLLNKIHYLGSSHRGNDHPDSRAQFYDKNVYSKRKINDLFSALKGITTCTKIIAILNENKVEAKLLKRLIDDYPNVDQEIAFFNNSFDHKAALKEGQIIPSPGTLPKYDEAFEGIEKVQQGADKYLKNLMKEWGEKLSYVGTGNKRFQIEVPDRCRSKVPDHFEFSTMRKGFKRYVTDKTKKLVIQMTVAEEVRNKIVKDATRQIFEKFDQSRSKWTEALACISNLDVLISLAGFSSGNGMCRPEVISSHSPFIEVEDGFHPFLSQDTFIPNGAKLGGEEGKPFILLTGPNMGGKSTYMRQIGILSILAHLGCFVPARKCRMSVVDRIFTRIGANDNIAEGESTFYVEMNETSSILKYSSNNSLILIDELGRGTATFDGTAIAYAVADKLAKMSARTIFSTHYHNLVETIQHLPAVQLGHMACMVENENEEDPTQETITFLYKLAEGPCPKSYGFNAARLAHIPDDVIRVSHKKAKEIEATTRKRDLFKKLLAFRKNIQDLTLEMFKDLKLTN